MKLISIVLLLIFLGSCGESSKIASQTNQKSSFENFSSIKLPDKLSFCGEEVPLEIPEVKERAEREFYMLLQQPGQIILYLKRAGRYFPLYEKLLKENNIPEDLKFLSVAESALYMARSNKGAEGLWQLMPGTAKLLGIQVDNSIDERRHPEKSTVAAIKYLKQGYQSSKSWLATVAGYNMGHENFQWSKTYQSGDDYFDLYLNEETSRFIFRIVIIKEIMENASKYGFNISVGELYKPDNVTIVKWDKSIPDMAEWAKKQSTCYKDVKILNPWILERNLPAPKAGKPFEIAIPAK